MSHSNFINLPANLDDYIVSKITYPSVILTQKQTGKKVEVTFYHIFPNLEDDIFFINAVKFLNVDLPGVAKTTAFYLPLNENSADGSIEFKFNLQHENENDYELTNEHRFIITDYYKNGNTYQLTKKYLQTKGANNDKMNPTIRSKIIFGVAAIIKQLHKKGLFNCDLKNSTTFLDDNFEPVIKDFGIHDHILGLVNLQMTVIVPLPYQIAPEIFLSDEITPACDVYSYAFFLYLMFSSNINFSRTFNNNSEIIYFKYVSEGFRPFRPENIPDHYWDLIEECWNSDPDARPSIDHIVELLRDDKFALNEFGQETDLEKLHEYQNRIDPL